MTFLAYDRHPYKIREYKSLKNKFSNLFKIGPCQSISEVIIGVISSNYCSFSEGFLFLHGNILKKTINLKIKFQDDVNTCLGYSFTLLVEHNGSRLRVPLKYLQIRVKLDKSREYALNKLTEFQVLWIKMIFMMQLSIGSISIDSLHLKNENQ